MAALTLSNLNVDAGGWQTATQNTLTASDTFTFNNSLQQRIIVTNGTGSDVTLNLDGAGAAAFNVEGYGELDPTAGLNVTIPNNQSRVLRANSRGRFLTGEVTMTGASGATCFILEG